MDIHKPKASHSWREFLIEIGTIICGILIALGLEQVAEWAHWQEKAHAARTSIHKELTRAYVLAEERIAHGSRAPRRRPFYSVGACRKCAKRGNSRAAEALTPAVGAKLDWQRGRAEGPSRPLVGKRQAPVGRDRMVRPWVAAVIAAATMLGFAARSAAEPDFSAERFKAHVAFLSDDLLEGREPGTRGHELAARYMAAQFDLMGLKPGGENGSWFQTVTLVDTTNAGPAPTLAIKGPKVSVTLRHGVDAGVGGPVGGGVANLVDAPMVFVGYGLFDKSLGIDDYKGLDVRGKVVVRVIGVLPGIDSETAAHLMAEAPRFASERGAVGMLNIPSRSNEKVFPWDRVLEFIQQPRANFVDKEGRPHDDAPNLKMTAIVKPSAAAGLFDGSKVSLAQALDAADKGRPKGFALKTTVTTRAETSARRYSSPEVIGIVEGSDPKLKDQYVVLMGHLDHLGMKPEGATGDRIYNGALDNAAGSATLLEVARAFATEPVKPRRSVLIVSNTGEEKGLLGADYFAHYPTVPAGQIVSGVDLDMPILLYDFTDVVAYGGQHSTLSAAIAKAGAAMNVKLSPDPQPEQAIFVRSDHYPLVKQGVPAVMLATGMANGGAEAWSRFLSTNYHQPSDDISQPILWASGAKFARLNYLISRELANSDQAPQWYAGDYFGDLFANAAVKAARGK